MPEIETLITEFECLYCGIGFKQIDNDAARQKLLQARGLGSRYAEAWCLFTGWNCEKDEEAAATLFRELAEEGDERAQAMFGRCLYHGWGVTRDHAEAVSWFQKSNHAEAQDWLGWCYYCGEGITRDYTKAVKWYHMAAEQGHAVAQCSLGMCYRDGDGVTQDCTLALKWHRMACWSDPREHANALVHCLYEASEALLDTGDRIESAELLWAWLWEAIGVELTDEDYAEGDLEDISYAFWTKTLPPLRLIAAHAVFLAGESAGLDIYHEGIRDEAELVRESLKWAGLPYGPIDPMIKRRRVGKRGLAGNYPGIVIRIDFNRKFEIH